MQNQVRIIGGRWRSRKIDFPNLEGLRPTPDRVRETLFNWLLPVIFEARCLDLFAGSGAHGFEALSRGAKEVVFVDTNPKIINALKQNAQKLGAAIETHAMKAQDYLETAREPFDIIFLDPPFQKELLAPLCSRIAEKKLLKEKGFIYIEAEKDLTLDLPSSWEILKHKTTQHTQYMLAQHKD